MKKVYLLLVFLAFSTSIFSSHIVGGDITVKHLTGNNFNVFLRFYRDCKPGTTAFEPAIELGLFDKVTNALVDSFNLNLNSVTPLSLGDACYAPNLCVEEGLYSAVVHISNNLNGYYLSWQRCCRNSIIQNITIPWNTPQAFYAEIADPALANSTPTFGSYSKTYMCVGTLNTIDFSATDINGDNLVYSITTPLRGNATATNSAPTTPSPGPYPLITWQSPYSLSNILGSNPNISINPLTGILTVTPTIQGTFVFAVKVEEYRGGTKIGEIRREIQYQVISCINPITPGPSAVLSCNSPTAVITASSSASVTGYSWAGAGIISGANTTSPTVASDGTYTVTTTSSSGCTYTATVSVFNSISYPIVSTGNTLFISCQHPNGTISASSSPAGVNYSWAGPGIQSGANTSTPTVSLAGTYTVTVTDPTNGCATTRTVSVLGDSDLPGVTTNSTLSLNCLTTSGTINASSSTPGVNYVWTGPGIVSGANTANPTINTGGTYTVTVTNPNNSCTSVATINVNQNISIPNLSTPSASIITCVAPTSTITINSSTSGINYNWTGPGIVSGSTSNTPVVNTPGTYTVVVTNPTNGCTNTTSIYVNNNITNPNILAGSSPTLTCTSTSLTITANSSTANANFVWTGPGITSNGNTTTPTVNTPGTYTVTVTDPVNGCTSTTSVLVNNNVNIPQVSTGSPLTLTCVLNSGTISASSPTPNVTYQWTGPNIISGSSTSSPTVNASGTYTVVVTDQVNGCTKSATVGVTTDNSIPNLSATAALTLTCNNATDTIFANSTTPNVTYSWSGPGIVSGNNTPSPMVNAAGTYTVTIVNPSSGCTNLATVAVINNVIHPIIAAGPPVILNCAVTSDTLTLTSSTSGVNYNWNGPNIVSGSTTPKPIVNGAGTYTVVVTNPTNSCTSTATIMVSNNTTIPNLTTASTPLILTCSSTSNTISANSTTPAVTYLWTGPGIVFGDSTSSPIVNAAGTYTVVITDPSNGCTNSSTILVSNNFNSPVITAGANLILTCLITSNSITVTTDSAATYNWSGPGIVTGGNTSTPTVNTSGTYTVTVTNPVNGCTSTTTVSVTDAPIIHATAANNTTIILGNSTTLVATGGVSYSWSPSSGLSCTNCVSPVASPEVTTYYCVTATDQYGCTDSACVKINVFDPCPPTQKEFPIPNVFSPNGDNRNDLFFIKDWNNECVQEFNIEIYDRWGLKMFESIGSNVHWDGRTASGLECPAGIYYYVIKMKKVRTEPKILKGYLTLVR